MKQSLNLKWELAAATLIAALVLIGTLWNVQPFRSVIDFGQSMKTSWEEDGFNAGPRGYGRGRFSNPGAGSMSRYNAANHLTPRYPDRSYGFFGNMNQRSFERRTLSLEVNPIGTASRLRGRDIVRLGQLQSLAGTLKKHGEEWRLKAGAMEYDIHMGPTGYRTVESFTLQEGARAIVAGFVYESDIAVTTIETGGRSITLRDPSGRPGWAGTEFGNRKSARAGNSWQY